MAKQGDPIRPPWALLEPKFIEICTRCSECVRHCPEHILKKGSGGFPEIDFHISGCVFCGQCVEVCTEAALVKQENARPWGLLATVSDSCISLHGVTCRACGDACDEQAILFKIESRGVSTPMIDESKCTGCGFCLKPCPVDAMKFKDSTEGEKRCLS